MRSPSSRILDQVIDYYNASPAQDVDGGVQFTYPLIPTLRSVPCSVQAEKVDQFFDPEQQRLTQERYYKIILGQSIAPNPKDKFIYIDHQGVSHTIFAHVERDDVGKGAVFVVFGIEKI